MIPVEETTLLTFSLKCAACGVEWEFVFIQRGIEQDESCECPRCQGFRMYFMGARLETVPQEPASPSP